MKPYSILTAAVVLMLAVTSVSYSQANSTFEKGLEMRGLTKNDITIPVNFDEAAASRAGFKLILPFVKDLMQNPLKSFSFPDTLLTYSRLKTDDLVLQLFSLLDYRLSQNPIRQLSYTNNPELILLNYLSAYRSKTSPLSEFTKDERDFLKRKILSAIADADDDKGNNTDIFKFNAGRDSSISNAKKTIELLNKTDKKILYQKCYDELRFFFSLFEESKKGKFNTMLED